MAAASDNFPRLWVNADLAAPEAIPLGAGTAAVFCARCPDKAGANEDAVALAACGAAGAVLAVADGFGGQPVGEQAARLALEALMESVGHAPPEGDLREGILNGFDQANKAVSGLGVGAATTLAVVEIDVDRVRPYHVGDSGVLVVGQRGKIKLQTVFHSPIGYAVEAGWLDAHEALHHEDLHVVSNMVGSPDMRIDLGPRVRLDPRDTLLVGSDGLFDNLTIPEIVEAIRTRPIATAAGALAAACRQRMCAPEAGHPSKPDDLSFVLYRPAQ